MFSEFGIYSFHLNQPFWVPFRWNEYSLLFAFFLAYLIKYVLRKGKKIEQKMHQKSNYSNSENVSYRKESFMDVDGNEIFIEQVQGVGDLNFILIHNAGADHRFFTYQMELLKKWGNVIWSDLPGSGKSSPTSSYKIEDLSSLVATVCKKMALKNICPIGLNNGANIAIDMVLNHPLPIESLILIDPSIFMLRKVSKNSKFGKEIL